MPSVTSTEHYKLSPAISCLGERYPERNWGFFRMSAQLSSDLHNAHTQKGRYFLSLWKSVEAVADRLAWVVLSVHTF